MQASFLSVGKGIVFVYDNMVHKNSDGLFINTQKKFIPSWRQVAKQKIFSTFFKTQEQTERSRRRFRKTERARPVGLDTENE